MAMPTIAIPGEDLGSTSKCIPGPGTHVHGSHVYSSLAGSLVTNVPSKAPGPQKRLTKITAPEPNPLPTVTVIRPLVLESSQQHGQSKAVGKSEILPDVNSIVLCRVTRITPRQATVAILVVGDTVLDGEWQGLIRVQDVRATEKDRVKIFESFRPGDIVRAIVISLGDQSSYYLSTASNNLGVIIATSEAGNAMYPVSWKEYRDPETGRSESRKVAKPF